jgi:hypothetical protein
MFWRWPVRCWVFEKEARMQEVEGFIEVTEEMKCKEY